MIHAQNYTSWWVVSRKGKLSYDSHLSYYRIWKSHQSRL